MVGACGISKWEIVSIQSPIGAAAFPLFKDAVTERIEIIQNQALDTYKTLGENPHVALNKTHAQVAKEPLSVGDIDSVRSGLLINVGLSLTSRTVTPSRKSGHE